MWRVLLQQGSPLTVPTVQDLKPAKFPISPGASRNRQAGRGLPWLCFLFEGVSQVLLEQGAASFDLRRHVTQHPQLS